MDPTEYGKIDSSFVISPGERHQDPD